MTSRLAFMLRHRIHGTCSLQVGLCQNLRNLLWYEEEDSDSFFPRVYMISEPEEKDAFIGNQRLLVFCPIPVHTPSSAAWALGLSSHDVEVQLLHAKNGMNCCLLECLHSIASNIKGFARKFLCKFASVSVCELGLRPCPFIQEGCTAGVLTCALRSRLQLHC